MKEQINELENALQGALMHENECAFVHTSIIKICLDTLNDREQILLDAENDAYSRGVLAGIELGKIENKNACKEALEKQIAKEVRARVLKEIKERSVCFQGEETFGKRTKVLLFTEEAYHAVFG